MKKVRTSSGTADGPLVPATPLFALVVMVAERVAAELRQRQANRQRDPSHRSRGRHRRADSSTTTKERQ